MHIPSANITKQTKVRIGTYKDLILTNKINKKNVFFKICSYSSLKLFKPG
jgi:hypothetical protein